MTSELWSRDIEDVLESIRSNAAVMSKFHKKNYIYYKGQLKYYRIPVIVISGLNSVIAVGLQPYMEQGLISASNCLLALICGIIGSIELFLGLQSSMESELIASRNFYLLAIDIYKTLTLNRDRRTTSGKDFLEEKYSEYTKLYGNANLLRGKIPDKLASLPGVEITDFGSDISSSDLESGRHSTKQFFINEQVELDKARRGMPFSIDQELEKVRFETQQGMQAEMDQARQGMQAELEKARLETQQGMQAEMDQVRQGMQAELEKVRQGMQAEMDQARLGSKLDTIQE